MKKLLLVALLCGGTSLCVVPVAQAYQGTQVPSVRVTDSNSSLAAPITIVAANNASKSKPESAVQKCIKWVKKEVKVRIGNRIETRTQTVCVAVRG